MTSQATIAELVTPPEPARPADKHQLVFRATPGRRDGVYELEYEAEVHVPRPGALTPPFSERRVLLLYQSTDTDVGAAIYRLMQQFWALEASVTPLLKERDDLQLRVRELEGECKSLRAEADELRREMGKAPKQIKRANGK